jgi:hypothetical protein
MSILNILLFVTGIFAMTLAFRRGGKRSDIYRVIIESLGAYCVLVCIISILLLLCNIYNPLLALSLTAIIPFAFIKKSENGGEKVQAYRSVLDYRYVIVFIILMIPIVAARYDYVSMDADIGVYAVRAMQIQSERKLFSDNVIRSSLHGAIRDRYDADNLLSFNKTTKGGAYLPGTHLVPTEDSVFYFHAYPAWPVLLATWGAIFGITKQYYVMILLYALIISLLFLALQSVSSNSRFSIILTVLFGSSPLLVYFTKYGTSELFLLFLVLYAIHLIAEGRTLDMILAGLSLTLFCLTHVSAFAYAPLLFLAFYYFVSRQKASRYYLFLVISFLGFLLSIPYGYYVSRNYFRDVYVATFSSLKTGLSVALFIGFAGLAVSIYGYFVSRDRYKTAGEII